MPCFCPPTAVAAPSIAINQSHVTRSSKIVLYSNVESRVNHTNYCYSDCSWSLASTLLAHGGNRKRRSCLFSAVCRKTSWSSDPCLVIVLSLRAAVPAGIFVIFRKCFDPKVSFQTILELDGWLDWLGVGSAVLGLPLPRDPDPLLYYACGY